MTRNKTIKKLSLCLVTKRVHVTRTWAPLNPQSMHQYKYNTFSHKKRGKREEKRLISNFKPSQKRISVDSLIIIPSKFV